MPVKNVSVSKEAKTKSSVKLSKAKAAKAEKSSSAKGTKSTKSTNEKPTPAPTPTPALTPALTPVAKQSAAAAAPAETVAAVVEAPQQSALEVENNGAFATLLTRLSEVVTTVRALQNEVRNLQKGVQKERKDLSKRSKRRRNNKPRAPSGFAKPTYLSQTLCDFLNVPLGTMMARTEVTKRLTNYIKENNCQNPENKKIILMNDTLTGLLQPGDEEVTFFNLQRFMKVHFHKEDPTAASS